MYEFGLLSIPVNSISFILKVAVSTIGKINWMGDVGMEKADRRQCSNAGERL